MSAMKKHMSAIKFDKVSHIKTSTGEYWGMLYHGIPNGYGIEFNHFQCSMLLGLFKNGEPALSYAKDLAYVLENVDKFQPSTFYKDYVFIGDILPGYEHCRYGVAIINNGMYIGKFPNGYAMKHMEGTWFDMNGNGLIGEWNLSIDMENISAIKNDEVYPF